MLFSQRSGIKPIEKIIQLDSMNEALRVGLWNCMKSHHWKLIPDDDMNRFPPLADLFISIWTEYFKKPLDELSPYFSISFPKVHKYFFDAQWFEVYDFIEFVVNHYNDEVINIMFINDCNIVLEREMSGFRFIDKHIQPITTNEEISSIETAMTDSPKAIIEHLNRALSLLSDKKTPDYRNSIKESISAVESLCRLITGKSKATLGDALKNINCKIEIHPALQKGFENIYGYTSDEDGVRHSMIEESSCCFEDAIYMLVSCSCFVNYLKEKARKVGIQEI